MIPKKIHFCWLSNEAFPKKNRECINSWKKFLPEYEFIKWDFSRFPLQQSDWVREAFENKKYAFAADYIRLFALYNEGGIYLDTDVEVKKSYNDLLDRPYFMGCESTPNIIEAATIGVEPHSVWLKNILKHYEDRHFVHLDGSFDTEPLPQIMRDILQKNYGLKFIDKPSNFNPSDSAIQLLPVEYFSPKHWDTKELYPTKNTYSIHHFAGSWLPPEPMKERIKKGIRKSVSLLLGQNITDKLVLFYKKIKRTF